MVIWAVTSLPGSSTVLTFTPFLAVSVVVTVPSFFVSTTRVEPSLNLVVSVTVPVFLSVTVVVVEPSGFFSVSVVAVSYTHLDVYKRQLQNDVNSAAQFDNIQHGDAFDFLGLADHLRQSYNGVDGQGNGQYNTAFYVAVQAQIRELEKLQVKGEYIDKLLNSGFEWDMPGLDHASVGVLDKNGETSLSGIHAFEWLYASQGSGDDPTSLFTLEMCIRDRDRSMLRRWAIR